MQNRKSFRYAPTFDFETTKNLSKLCSSERFKDKCKYCPKFEIEGSSKHNFTLGNFTLNQFVDLKMFQRLTEVKINKALFKRLTNKPGESVLGLNGLTFIKNHVDFAPMDFPKLPSLFSLTITNNTFKVVSKNKFVTKKFPSLGKLELRSNGIKTFKQQEMNKLKILDLSNNQIEHLEEGVFDFMPSLKEIILHENPLKSPLIIKHFVSPVNGNKRFRCECDYELLTANGFTAEHGKGFKCDSKKGCVGCSEEYKTIYLIKKGNFINKRSDVNTALDLFCPMKVQEKTNRVSKVMSLKSQTIYSIILSVVFIAVSYLMFFDKKVSELNTSKHIYPLVFVVLVAIVAMAVLDKRDKGLRDSQEHLLLKIRDLKILESVLFIVALPMVILLSTVRIKLKSTRNKIYWFAFVTAVVVTLIVANNR